MNAELRAIMKLDVPLIVRLGRREMRLSEVVRLVPGAIIELPKHADEELELLVNNKVIGLGRAVKVSENFGMRMAYIGDLRARVTALGGSGEPASGANVHGALSAAAEGVTANLKGESTPGVRTVQTAQAA